jgi:hypothetical protein
MATGLTAELLDTEISSALTWICPAPFEKKSATRFCPPIEHVIDISD